MTVDSNTSSGRGNDPEQIDLIELLLQLWRGKMTIIVAVINRHFAGRRLPDDSQRKMDIHGDYYPT